MLVTSKTALLGVALLGLAGAMAGRHVLGLPSLLVWPFVGVICAIALYFMAGLALCRLPARQLAELVRLPAFVLWRLAGHVTTVLSYRSADWVRTPRR